VAFHYNELLGVHMQVRGFHERFRKARSPRSARKNSGYLNVARVGIYRDRLWSQAKLQSVSDFGHSWFFDWWMGGWGAPPTRVPMRGWGGARPLGKGRAARPRRRGGWGPPACPCTRRQRRQLQYTNV